MERDAQGMAYSFRFLNVDENVAEKLAQEFGAKITDMHNGKGKCVVLPLSIPNQSENIKEAVKSYSDALRKFDVFASILIEQDTDIVEVPGHVLDMVRDLGAELTLSYTYVGE